MSPVWVYFRKVPKILKIDSSSKKLEIQKKRKTLKYNMDKIRFYKRKTKLFFILEIHATFESSRNGQFEKLATTIIVPNWGLSWNRKKMEEIVNEFKALDIEEINSRPNIPIYEYFYN
jgi:translation initiation factor 2 alpha subunit (eIF-2alpha)